MDATGCPVARPVGLLRQEFRAANAQGPTSPLWRVVLIAVVSPRAGSPSASRTIPNHRTPGSTQVYALAMTQKPIFVRFLALWFALLAVTAVSFYLSLLLRVAHPLAAVACLIIALLCFGGSQFFVFSLRRFVLRASKEKKARTAETPSAAPDRHEG